MKKTIFMKVLLIAFPVLAVGLATTVNSVTVFDTVTSQTQYFSYFNELPVENLKMVLPLTGMLALISGVLAVVYLAKKNLNMLKAAGYAALASSCLAAVPMMVRGDVLVIPNVGLPIFMVLEYLVAYLLEKDEKAREEKLPKARKKNTPKAKKK